MSSSSFSSLQTLLRPTLLLVTLLSQQASASAVHMLRARGAGLVEQLQQDLLDAGYDDATVSEATFAQCALLDDAVRRHLAPSQRAEWDREWLQARFFGARDAQGVVLQRIEAAANGLSASLEMTVMYRMMLGLGFAQGAIDATYRQQLMAMLAPSTKPALSTTVSPILPPAFADQAEASTTTKGNVWARTAIVAACLVALWAGLSLHITRLTHHTPQPVATAQRDVHVSLP